MMGIDLVLISSLARRGRIDIIRSLRQYPNRDFSINELARVSRIPVMTCWRGVRELESLDILTLKKVANSEIVTLNQNADLIRFLRQIPDSDPHRYAARLFSTKLDQLPGIVEARLFGKVAKGDHAPDSETDIAVVFDGVQVSKEDATAHCNRIAKEIKSITGMTVQPHMIMKDHLDQGRGFAAELRDKEILWRKGE